MLLSLIISDIFCSPLNDFPAIIRPLVFLSSLLQNDGLNVARFSLPKPLSVRYSIRYSFIDISLSEDFCDSTPTGFEANRISSSSYMTSRRNPVLLICRGPPVNLFMVSSDINILTLSFSFNISLPLAFFPFRTIFLFLNCLKIRPVPAFLSSLKIYLSNLCPASFFPIIYSFIYILIMETFSNTTSICSFCSGVGEVFPVSIFFRCFSNSLISVKSLTFASKL